MKRTYVGKTFRKATLALIEQAKIDQFLSIRLSEFCVIESPAGFSHTQFPIAPHLCLLQFRAFTRISLCPAKSTAWECEELKGKGKFFGFRDEIWPHETEGCFRYLRLSNPRIARISPSLVANVVVNCADTKYLCYAEYCGLVTHRHLYYKAVGVRHKVFACTGPLSIHGDTPLSVEYARRPSYFRVAYHANYSTKKRADCNEKTI